MRLIAGERAKCPAEPGRSRTREVGNIQPGPTNQNLELITTRPVPKNVILVECYLLPTPGKLVYTSGTDSKGGKRQDVGPRNSLEIAHIQFGLVPGYNGRLEVS